MKKVLCFSVVLVLLLVSLLVSGCGGTSPTTPASPPTTPDTNPLPTGWVRLYDFSTGFNGFQGIVQNTTTYATTTVTPAFDTATGWTSVAFDSITDTNTQKFCFENTGAPLDLSAYKTLTVRVKHTAGSNFKEIAFAVMETGYSNWNGDSKTSISDQTNGDLFTIDLTKSVDLTKIIYLGVECKSATGASGSGTVYISSIDAEPK